MRQNGGYVNKVKKYLFLLNKLLMLHPKRVGKMKNSLHEKQQKNWKSKNKNKYREKKMEVLVYRKVRLGGLVYAEPNVK